MSAFNTVGLLLFLYSENSVKRKSGPSLSLKFFTGMAEYMNAWRQVKLKYLTEDFKMDIMLIYSRTAVFEYLDIQ